MWTLLTQLYKFTMSNGKFWLLPAILMFVAIGALIVVLQSSTIAPFIYSLF